jgi:hypothetical protein
MIVPGKFVGHDAWWLRSTKDARADIFRTRKGRTMTTEADENTGEKACSATTVLGRSRRGRDSAATTGFERKGDVAWIRRGGGALKTEIYARHYCGHFSVPEARSCCAALFRGNVIGRVPEFRRLSGSNIDPSRTSRALHPPLTPKKARLPKH